MRPAWTVGRRGLRLAALAAAGLAAILMGLTTASCGLPTDDEAHAIDPDALPESLRPGFVAATTTTAPPPLTEARTVYLLTQLQDIERTVVVAVERQIERNADLAGLLATLFGVTTSPEEQAAGYFNPLELFELLNTTVADAVATIDILPLSPEDPDTLELVAAQLVFTATAWEGVQGVRILLEGEEVSVPTSDADAEPGSVLRTDAYEQFQPDFAPATTTSTTLSPADGA